MKSIFLFLLLVAFQVAKSQNRTVVEMTVTDQKEAKSPKLVSFKLNPTMLLNGNIPVYVEFGLLGRLRLEASAGVTLRDFYGELIDGALENSFEDDGGITKQYDLGYSYGLGLRLYASSYTYQPEGVFFGLDYRNFKYNSTITSCGDIKDLNIGASRVYQDLRLLIGSSYYFDENVFLEYYSGFGLRDRNVDYGICNDLTNTVDIAKDQRTVLLVSLGLKFGVTF